jgi:hypothetical protein
VWRWLEVIRALFHQAHGFLAVRRFQHRVALFAKDAAGERSDGLLILDQHDQLIAVWQRRRFPNRLRFRSHLLDRRQVDLYCVPLPCSL